MGRRETMTIGVFHPGTQHSWQTALALQQLDRLAWYATSIFYRPDRWPYKLERLPGPIGRKLHSEFIRFQNDALDPALVRTSGTWEWLERIAARMGRRKLAVRLDTLGNERFVKAVADDLGDPALQAVWGYDGSSLATFRAAKREGKFCILDRTIGDWRHYNAVMHEVGEAFPQFFHGGEAAAPDDLIARDRAEFELADVIVTGSRYCADTIAAHEPMAVADKISVLPYCFDQTLFARAPARKVSKGPVRFLFLGVASPRKGIHLLLEAIRRIPRSAASLTIVGRMDVPAATFAPYADRVELRGSVPRSEVPAIMAEHDVLVFPSYFEGSSLALLEALASGLAIIQSEAAGNGATAETGLILPRQDVDALTEAMLTLVEDRARLAQMQVKAPAAAETYSFANYRTRIDGLLHEWGL